MTSKKLNFENHLALAHPLTHHAVSPADSRPTLIGVVVRVEPSQHVAAVDDIKGGLGSAVLFKPLCGRKVQPEDCVGSICRAAQQERLPLALVFSQETK